MEALIHTVILGHLRGERGENMKRVRVEGYNFDSLPGHVTISGSGVGSNLKIAAKKAIESMLKAVQLRGRHTHSFQCRVSVSEVKGEENVSRG